MDSRYFLDGICDLAMIRAKRSFASFAATTRAVSPTAGTARGVTFFCTFFVADVGGVFVTGSAASVPSGTVVSGTVSVSGSSPGPFFNASLVSPAESANTSTSSTGDCSEPGSARVPAVSSGVSSGTAYLEAGLLPKQPMVCCVRVGRARPL